MKSTRLSLRAFALCVSAVIVVGSAHARTISAAAGSPASLTASGQSIDDFAWFNTGMGAPFATSSATRTWVIPVVLDTAGLKTFIVKGEPASNGVSCFVDQLGGTTAVSTPVTVTVTGTNPFVPLVLNIAAGTTVVVRCVFSRGTARVLLVDHTP